MREKHMIVSEAIEKMIAFYKGSIHDIDHFIKVWSYAKTIGELEGLDAHTQEVLELAAVIHDIACPLCREKYGKALGKLQEQEGPIIAQKMLSQLGFENYIVERICFLIGHHHTYDNIDGLDYQILVEADFLVNLYEDDAGNRAIDKAYKRIFKTETGKKIFRLMFGYEEED